MNLIPAFTALSATALAILALAKYAPRLKLLAMPGGHRLHRDATPMVGGLGMLVGLLVGLAFDSSYLNLYICLIILGIVGALDDRFVLPSWSRFLAQVTAAYLMIQLTGVSLISLGSIFSENSTVLLGRWSTAMTIFAVIGVINAVNMSDGLDGLAGGLVLITLVSILSLGSSQSGLILISIGALIGFLIWNVRLAKPKAKVFMGDAGSTMLGLLLAYLLIAHSQAENGIAPVTALWLLALPLIDAVAVLIVRPMRGKSPFAADRAHYHHQFVDRGLSVNKALICALTIQIALILIGVAFLRQNIADHIQLAVFLSIFMLYLASLFWFTRRPR